MTTISPFFRGFQRRRTMHLTSTSKFSSQEDTAGGLDSAPPLCQRSLFKQLTMLGPIQKLRVCGAFCSCFESEQEHAVRVADLMLQAVPIRWHRKIRVQPYAQNRDTLMGATNDACCCSKPSEIPASVRNDSVNSTTVTPYIAVEASMTIVDSRKGPALVVTSNKLSFADDDDEDDEYSGLQVLTKSIPLRDIEMASRGMPREWEDLDLSELKRDGIIVYSKGKKSKLLVIQVMPGSKLSLSRDEAQRHLNTMIGWNQAGVIEDDFKNEYVSLLDEEKKETDSGGAALVTSQKQLVTEGKQISMRLEEQGVEVPQID